MRAVVCEHQDLEVREVPTPVPAKGQVLLKVQRTGICGSDLHARVHADAAADVAAEVGYRDFMRPDTPVVMGHEFVGEVVEYGPGTKRRWAPGTSVVALPLLRQPDGLHMTGLSPKAAGGYAEFVAVSEAVAFEVPANVPVEHAAMTEPLAVAWHAVRKGDVGAKDVAVVVGCGPIGLAVILMLKASGVRTVPRCPRARRRSRQRLGSTRILACLSGSARASNASATPSRPTVPVTSGLGSTVPDASICSVSWNSAGS